MPAKLDVSMFRDPLPGHTSPVSDVYTTATGRSVPQHPVISADVEKLLRLQAASLFPGLFLVKCTIYYDGLIGSFLDFPLSRVGGSFS
ncbi:hypothetical protein GWI33_005420 [Rhynchophorus ferrugineus]|uniref:Uncharacterized protein n=1 Tax=Rhynchophorus ferrugineus TaxID=354439 RepID=A0A834IN80_RHYFE|nr:hypothetical protein GWI33_005420 [Rhynchophorus ferrugineus]